MSFLLAFAASLAAASSTAPLYGEFGGYDNRLDIAGWERFDLVLTNTTADPQNLAVCPSDAQMVLRTHQRSARPAFALKFNEDSWSHDCQTRAIAPGERVTLGMFFRTDFEFGPDREINLDTNLGAFQLVGPGQENARERMDNPRGRSLRPVISQ